MLSTNNSQDFHSAEFSYFHLQKNKMRVTELRKNENFFRALRLFVAAIRAGRELAQACHAGRSRDFLEKPRVQPVCRRDEQGVGSFGRREQVLLAERKLVRIAAGAVIAIDTVFNRLRITGGYHQNGLRHIYLLRGDEDDARSGCVFRERPSGSGEPEPAR